MKLVSDGKPLLRAELPKKERVNDEFSRFVKNTQLIQCVHCSKFTCTQKDDNIFPLRRLLLQLVKLVLKQDYYVKYLLSIYFVSHLQFFNVWVW